MKMTKEMKMMIEEIYEEVGYDCEACCARCPYAQQCSKEEIYWECGVWEDSMGDDL